MSKTYIGKNKVKKQIEENLSSDSKSLNETEEASANISGSFESDSISQLDCQLSYYSFVYDKTSKFRDALYLRCSIIFVICAFLVGTIGNIIKDFGLPINPKIEVWIFFTLLSIFLLFAIISIFFSLVSIKPGRRLIVGGFETVPVISAFPYISRMKREDFKKKCIEMDKESLLSDMLDGIYNLSQILNRRYKFLKTSCFFMFLAIVFFAILISYLFIGMI